MLLEVSRVMHADLETDRVLDNVLEQAIQVIEAEAGSLWTLEENGTVIVPRVVTGPVSSTLLTMRMRPGEGFVGLVTRTGQGILVADAQSDPRLARRVDSATGFVTRSMISAPLNGRSGTIGCIQLLNKRGGEPFQDSDLALLTALGTQAALVIENARLLEQTLAFARSLQAAWIGTLDTLIAALAARDTETKTHCYRTVELAVVLARRMRVPESDLPPIARGALLHDIGKIGIPDEILFKPGPERLTPEEMEIMKQHVRFGYDMLRHVSFFQDAMPVVVYHHENHDGTGYLAGLMGDEIPLAARIFHVVDVYDALTSVRPYKGAWPHEEALAEIRRASGSHFAPELVAALETLTLEELACIRLRDSFSPEMRDLLGRGIR